MTHESADEMSESTRIKLLRWAESGEDYDKALGLAIACSRSPDRWLRINALHCFGYIARVYGRLDLDTALPLLCEAQGNIADAEVAAAAQDALDDLNRVQFGKHSAVSLVAAPFRGEPLLTLLPAALRTTGFKLDGV